MERKASGLTPLQALVTALDVIDEETLEKMHIKEVRSALAADGVDVDSAVERMRLNVERARGRSLMAAARSNLARFTEKIASAIVTTSSREEARALVQRYISSDQELAVAFNRKNGELTDEDLDEIVDDIMLLRAMKDDERGE